MSESPIYGICPVCRNTIPSCTCSSAIKQEPMPKGSGVPIQDLVIEDIKLRKEFCIKKYGEPLLANNGRNTLVDIYQELLDAVIYIKLKLVEDNQNGN